MHVLASISGIDSRSKWLGFNLILRIRLNSSRVGLQLIKKDDVNHAYIEGDSEKISVLLGF